MVAQLNDSQNKSPYPALLT